MVQTHILLWLPKEEISLHIFKYFLSNSMQSNAFDNILIFSALKFTLIWIYKNKKLCK